MTQPTQPETPARREPDPDDEIGRLEPVSVLQAAVSLAPPASQLNA